MKIRTDFVTNSSSSSFVLEIIIELKNGEILSYEAEGIEDSEIGEFYVTVSPKQLGQVSSIEQLINLLKDNVSGMDWGDEEPVTKIFDAENPITKEMIGDTPVELDADYDIDMDDDSFDAENFDWSNASKLEFLKALQFIERIRNIKSMKDIESIEITGNEYNYQNYERTYKYNLTTKEYTAIIEGEEFEKDGSSGGDLIFDDAESAEIINEDI